MSVATGDDRVRQSRVHMGTIVTIEVVGHPPSQRARRERDQAIRRAFAWFEQVERCCSRFDAHSELRQLCTTHGTPVLVSRLLFEAVSFAVAVAQDTDGAFDPTVGTQMEARGFTRHYRTGATSPSALSSGHHGTFRDVVLNSDGPSIQLMQPLLLDLGAVAKGLAIDLAARELAPLVHFAIDAGGDLYLGGRNANDAPWTVGIKHPRQREQLLSRITVCDAALCTSGDYERRVDGDTMVGHGPSPGEHHLLNPHTGHSPQETISASVLAPTAMVADALATAACVLGSSAGVALLERHALRGCLVDTEMHCHFTKDWPDV